MCLRSCLGCYSGGAFGFSFVLLFGAPLLFVVVSPCYVALVFLRLCIACFSLSLLSAYALLVLEGLGLGEYAGMSLAELIK